MTFQGHLGQMATNNTPISYPYSDPAAMMYYPHHGQVPDDLQREWDKLRVEQEKLALQQERMQLDQELLENEKRNFRRSSKLKRTTAATATASLKNQTNDDEIQRSVTFDSQTGPSGITDSLMVQELRKQLAEAEAKLKERDAGVNDLRTNLESQLADAQKSLTSMLLEKDLLLQERDSVQLGNQVEQPARNTSLNRCQKCSQQQIKMEQLQDDLGNLRLACSMYEVKQEELIAQHEAEVKKLEDIAAVLRREKEALESELQSPREIETETLQQKIEEQAKQLDDYKLTISRDKLLLEEATTKSVDLQIKCSGLEARVDELEVLIEALQISKEMSEQKHDDLEQELHNFKEEQHNRLSQSGSSHSPVSELSDDERSTNSAIVIPLDDSHLSSKLLRSGMKHVVEREWTNRKGVMGLYTGWVDLAGNPHGHGTWRIQDGSIYDGEWKRGLRDGKSSIKSWNYSEVNPTFSYHRY